MDQNGFKFTKNGPNWYKIYQKIVLIRPKWVKYAWKLVGTRLKKCVKNSTLCSNMHKIGKNRQLKIKTRQSISLIRQIFFAKIAKNYNGFENTKNFFQTYILPQKCFKICQKLPFDPKTPLKDWTQWNSNYFPRV